MSLHIEAVRSALRKNLPNVASADHERFVAALAKEGLVSDGAPVSVHAAAPKSDAKTFTPMTLRAAAQAASGDPQRIALCRRIEASARRLGVDLDYDKIVDLALVDKQMRQSHMGAGDATARMNFKQDLFMAGMIAP